ncbi:MAG: 5'-nucleotidase C-terminal domain-containing protein [Solirubrobacteraceae bacterium]
MAPGRAELSEIVGHTSLVLHRGAVLQCPMNDLLLASIASTADTPLAFVNGWRYGAPTADTPLAFVNGWRYGAPITPGPITPGLITHGDLWDMVPPNPSVQATELTGADLSAMLEENLERTFVCDSYAQQGGYVKRCFGLQLHVSSRTRPEPASRSCSQAASQSVTTAATRRRF